MTMGSLRWSVVSGQRSVVSDHYSHQRMLLRVKLGKVPIERYAPQNTMCGSWWDVLFVEVSLLMIVSLFDISAFRCTTGCFRWNRKCVNVQ